jgi:hypothetical protein
MRASLFISLARRGPLLTLPLLATALATGCPPEPEPPPPAAPALRVSSAASLLDLGASTTISFSSRNTGDVPTNGGVIVTVAPPAAGAQNAGTGFVGVDEASALADSTITITPNNGEGSFGFRCGNRTGTVRLDLLATDTNAAASLALECIETTEFNVSIDVDPDEEACRRLQADGVSVCPITLEIAKVAVGGDERPIAAPGESVTVEVVEVTDVAILDGVRGIDPDGIPEVLTAIAGGPLADRLENLETDDAGNVNFFVVSPAFGVAQTVTLKFTVRDVEDQETLIFNEFQNQSALTIVAAKNELESTRTTTLTVAAKRTDGTPAVGESVTLVSASATPVQFTASPPTVTVDNGVATVVLGDDGTAAVLVTAPVVAGRGVEVPIQGTFDTGVDAAAVPPLVTTINLSVSEVGSVIGNAEFSAGTLKSDLQPPASVTLTVSAEQGEVPFDNVRVNVAIAPDSQALVNFGGSVGGTDAVRRSVTALSGGTVAFQVVPASPIARGTATVVVQMQQGNETIFNVSRTLIVERDPILQSVVFVAADPATVGVRGGTLPSTSTVSFKLSDDTGAPLAGVPVRFVTNATADRGVTVEQADISDAGGVVKTTLSAGTIAGPVTVVVTATPARGLPITVESGSIAVVGGLSTFLNSDFKCANRSGLTIQTGCTIQLVDRFTNRVGPNTQVQFRAEGGSITPSATTGADGTATGNFVTGNPGRPRADVAAWSYGRRIADPAVLGVQAAACVDGSTSTRCDLLAFCADPTNEFCPLAPSPSTPDLLAVSGGVVDTSRRCDADLAGDPRACGFPAGCLNGSGDDCNVALGCFDYSPATFCPHNGLVTIVASSRGEESFLDGNGNGILDFIDLNANGRQDGGEPIGLACRVTRADGSPGDPNCLPSTLVRTTECPQAGEAGFNADADPTCRDGIRAVDDFIDSPEPFLDKNGSCSRDNFLYASNGMTQIERQIATDLFSDVDGSQTFGFDPERDNVVTQANGTWDRDTEVFLETHVLEVGGARLLFGEACNPAAGQHTCRQSTSPTGTSTCVELADGSGIAPSCNPSLKVPQANGDAGDYRYAWVDANGNCPTTNFAAATTVTSQGSLTASAQERVLDEAVCGFFEGLDPDRPWCEVHPVLGAPAFGVSVFIDCTDTDTLDQTNLTFELTDEKLAAKEVFGIFVDPATCQADVVAP